MRLTPPVLLCLFVSACGGSSTPPPTPPAPTVLLGAATVSRPAAPFGTTFLGKYSPQEFAAMLEAGQQGTTKITGEPKCAISVYRVEYNTVGGAGEASTASEGLFVPSGDDPDCAGARPVMLYAHGTSVQKSYDMSDLKGNTETRLVAAMFAAQGFIVVAPSYAGYAGSSLPYHSYLDAEQQPADMLDGLRAARAAFAGIGAPDSGKLFVTGYSQGGHVALATQRAMQLRGAEFALTAGAASSGPYAMAEMMDGVFGGAPGPGMTVYLPMIVNGGQRAGAGLYGTPGDMYERAYAAGIENLLPGSMSSGELFSSGKLPARHLFAGDSQPQAPGYEADFGDGNLVRSSYRAAYLADMQARPCNAAPGAPLSCAPQHPLRRLSVRDDLRTFRPSAPVMLCGGSADPVVPYRNTGSQLAYWRANGASGVTELDLERSPGLGDPFRSQKLAFRTAKSAVRINAILHGESPAEAVAAVYHGGLVAPFCLSSTRQFFREAMR